MSRARAGKVVTTANGVKIVGHLNVPGRVAASASLLYAKNLFAFLETMVDKADEGVCDQSRGRAGQGDDADGRRQGGASELQGGGAAPVVDAAEPAAERNRGGKNPAAAKAAAVRASKKSAKEGTA
jgi:NAD(P) transhydrogenase subunit alpha